MIAIETKFLPETETRGPRIKAKLSLSGKSLVCAWDHKCGIEDNQIIAADKLFYSFDRETHYEMTTAQTSNGYVHIFSLPKKRG